VIHRRGLLAAALALPAVAQILPPGTRYIMSNFAEFPGGQDERLYISTSTDGLTWQALNGGAPVWQPPNWSPFNNVVRDPAIIFQDGWYWVAYTSGNYGMHQSFGLVKSTDLLHWQFVGDVSAVRPGATTDQLTWNPVWFRDSDNSIHLSISLNLGGTGYNPTNMKVFEMHPENGDFTQWSAPVDYNLPSSSTNELWLWKEGDLYNSFYVDLSHGGDWMRSTSKNLLTGWSTAQDIGFGSQEGGMMLPQPDGTYRMYLESGYSGLPVGYRVYDLDANLSNPSAGVLVDSALPMRNGKMLDLVPEPTSTALIALAGGTIALRRRRK